jgi:hypothetical protein
MSNKHQDFIIQGMVRDNSEHVFDSKYAYENQNIRIIANPNSDSTHTSDLLAMTNEKGNKYTYIKGLDGGNMIGLPVGQCLINEQWVVFTMERTKATTDEEIRSCKDRIYRLWMENDKIKGELLYEGHLNLDYRYPLETLPYYENEQIQKVYWTDGINQPRFINIVEKPEKRAKWTDTSFDFVATMDLLNTTVSVSEKYVGGKFPAGVIQWFFTYSRQFGQETNIFASTELYELKHSDRGAAPDEMTTQSFDIVVNGLDPSFDFVNVYSVIRTSLNNVPIAKCIGTIPIEEWHPYYNVTDYRITLTDTNLYGTAIDPQSLFYKGGESITAYTMEQKDNTLFLGNYNLIRPYIEQDVKDDLRNYAKLNFKFSDNGDKNKPHFRQGNKYRFGVQFQHKTGKWSEVVWIGDYICNKVFNPNKPTVGELKLDNSLNTIKKNLIANGYVKVRPVVVYPNMAERGIITQGVLAPTLYMTQNKSKLYPDYFFRFFSNASKLSEDDDMDSSNRFWYSKICWLSNIYEDDPLRNEYRVGKINGDGWIEKTDDENCPKIAEDFYSLYSPEINFDDSYQIYNINNISIIHNANIKDFTTESKHEVLTSSISKPTVGHRQWCDDSRRIAFYTMWNDYGTKPIDIRIYDAPGTSKEGESDEPYTTKVCASRWIVYGWNDYWHNSKGETLHDFIKATADEIDYFWFNAKYPRRIPSHYSPKPLNDTHYVGGFLWEDTFMNVNTDHSELLDKDIPTRSGGFMQYYGQWIYPVMLWQASGSICYDTKEKAASVLKSNKIINCLTADREEIGSELISSGTFCKVSNGINVIKVQNDSEYGAILYSNRVEDCILWKDSYSAIFYLNPTENSPKFNWNVEPYKRYIYQNRVDSLINPDEYVVNTDGVYNTGKIEDITRTLPYDDLRDDRLEFKWHNLGRDAERSCSADMKYMSTPNYIIKLDKQLFKNRFSTLQQRIPIVSIKQEFPLNMFGGTTSEALQKNNFLVAGNSRNIVDKNNIPLDNITITWSTGDTYYQVYECLKTYPSSFENENCITEVLKVPLETYYNLNGRYDTWKGNPTFATSPANWNLMNPIYNQKNNFFVYHGLDLSTNSVNSFPNSFTWTLAKWSGDTVDKWTQITLATSMDVDGSKGEITRLIKLQDNLLCFQPRGLSQILYNEREQIATGSGVPIELANSGKVSGIRYITEKVGCNNKWSICKTESGLYWIDDENKAIMAWNQQLSNLSDSLGFHSWISDMSTLDIWNPIDFKSFVTYYDPYYESVMFFYKDNMLSYNTQLNCFDSFFSYGYVPYYEAFEGTAFTLSDKDSQGKDTYKVWEQHKGNYNYFYVHDHCIYEDGIIKCMGRYDKDGLPTEYGYEPYWITLLVNPDMPYDKIFNNLDMRTDMWNTSGNLLEETFSHIEVWNEFQHNKSRLIRQVDVPKIHLPAQHSILKKKFRVWYVNIPRDTKIQGSRYYNRDRMRNTWLYLKLSKELIDDDKALDFPYISDNKHIIHHIGVSYFV